MLRRIYRVLQRDAFQPFTPPLKELAESMRSKSDDELCAILTDARKDYTSEAIEIAHEELRRRGHTGHPTGCSAVVVGNSSQLGGPERTYKSDFKGTAAGLGSLVFLYFAGVAIYFAGAAIYGGYEWLDSIGWIEHQENTSISARSDWLVGESKECWSATLDSDEAAHTHMEVGYAMSSVTCDDGPEHNMEVTFYGRKVQTEYKAVSWRCTKGMISFTCYQTGGEH